MTQRTKEPPTKHQVVTFKVLCRVSLMSLNVVCRWVVKCCLRSFFRYMSFFLMSLYVFTSLCVVCNRHNQTKPPKNPNKLLLGVLGFGFSKGFLRVIVSLSIVSSMSLFFTIDTTTHLTTKNEKGWHRWQTTSRDTRKNDVKWHNDI